MPAFDHRSGLNAAKERHTPHTLVETPLNKELTPRYRRQLNSPNRGKPASACLPFGSETTREGLDQEAICDGFMKDFGFRAFRVRCHREWARIQVAHEEIDRLFDKTTREAIVRRFKEVGFSFVSLDLQEYRTGSMNEPLSNKTG